MSATRESAIRFRKLIEAEKEIQGFKTEDLATAMGIGANTLNSYLRDPCQMRVSQLLLMADVLGIERSALINAIQTE